MKRRKSPKVYVVCIKLTVGLLLFLEKHGILERLNQLVMRKLKFCVWKGLVESDSFVWPEKEDLGWYSYDEILCAINPPVPETRQAFVLSRQDLDKIYQFMLKH